MNVSRKVLHLSLTLAMSLPGYAALASPDETIPVSSNEAALNATQLAAGKESAQQFKNAGDADRLRHRVNEPVKDHAERSRQEKQAPADQLKPQDARETPDLLRKQDRLRDQDLLQDQDRLRERDQLKDQDPQQDQDRLRDRDRLSEKPQTVSPQAVDDPLKSRQQFSHQFQDRYRFEQRSAGQGFNTSGSMYQRMGSGNAQSTGAGSSSGGRHTQGGGSGGRH